MSENKADPLREALKPLAAISLWRDKYQDGPDMLTNDKLARYFTADQVRAARTALAAPQPAAPNPNNLPDTWEYQAETNCVVCSGCMFRYGAEHPDGDGKFTCPNCGDGNGNLLATPSDFERAFTDACDEIGCAYDNEALLRAIADLKKPAAPLGGRDEIAAFLFARDEACISEGVTPDLLQWGRGQISLGKNAVHSGDCTKECHSCARCAYEIAVRDADAILAAIPQERGVDRAAIIEECILAAYAHHASMHVIEALRYLAGKETEMSEKYLVWSNEHRCWWRANSAGYTNKVDSAGRYDRAEAISIARGRGWPSTGIPDEVPVLERDAIECFGKTPN